MKTVQKIKKVKTEEIISGNDTSEIYSQLPYTIQPEKFAD